MATATSSSGLRVRNKRNSNRKRDPAKMPTARRPKITSSAKSVKRADNDRDDVAGWRIKPERRGDEREAAREPA